MQQTIIGIIIIIAGIGYAIYQNKKMKELNLEVQSTQTSTIADSIDIINTLSATDSNYRHYVELKGNVFTKEKVIAPFTEREVTYYRDTTYAVSEDKETYRDQNGNTRTRTRKREDRLTNEQSPVQVYFRDESYPEGICVDLESFGGDMELQSGCDRFEADNSDWMRRNSHYSGIWGRGFGSKFLGYRLVEKILMVNQPVYILGELYAYGSGYCVGKARVANKASMFTYKSEDELVANNKSAAKSAIIVAAVSVVVGICLIIFNQNRIY